MVRWIGVILVVGVLGVAIGWFAASRLGGGSDAPVSEAFGGWRLDCAAGGGCAISQRVIAKDSQAQLMQLVVSASEGGADPVLTIASPLGVWLPAGASVRFAGADEALALSYAKCLAGGCIANGPLNEAALSLMNSASEGSVVIVNRNRQGVAIPFSLEGFEEAYAALQDRRSTLSLWPGANAGDAPADAAPEPQTEGEQGE